MDRIGDVTVISLEMTVIAAVVEVVVVVAAVAAAEAVDTTETVAKAASVAVAVEAVTIVMETIIDAVKTEEDTIVKEMLNQRPHFMVIFLFEPLFFILLFYYVL